MVNQNQNNKCNAGFTLMELIIVLGILGILITAAYPSYKILILKSRRADALQTLIKDQIILEHCYAQNIAYNIACAALPPFPQRSIQGFYNITLSNTDSSTYILTATPIGDQAQDTDCTNISINQSGVKTATDSSGIAQTICWNPI